MKSKIFVWICFIISIAFFFLQCKTRQEKVIISQHQAQNTDDSIVFKQLRKNVHYHKGDSLFALDKYDSALFFYNKTLSDEKVRINLKCVQQLYNQIGVSYLYLANYKKAKYYFTQALSFYKSETPDLIDANTLDNLGVVNQRLYDADSALYCFQRVNKIYSNLLTNKDIAFVKLNLHIGDVYKWVYFDYYNAEKYYYKALQLFEVREHDNNGNLNFFILYNLASVNRLKMDYNKSLSYGIQTLQLVENKEKFKKYQEITYALVANIYTLSDYNKSIEFYKKAIEVNSKSTKPNYEYRTLYYINLAYANYQLGKYRDAISYGKIALKSINKAQHDFNQISSCYEYLGISYQGLKNFDKAHGFLQSCLDIRIKHFGKKHLKTASAYSLLGKFYTSKQMPDSALYYFQLALTYGSGKFINSNLNANPLLADCKGNNELIDIMSSKAEVLKKRYMINSNDSFSLRLSLNCYELVDSLVSFYRRYMDNELAKLSYSINNNKLYESGIESANLLFQKKNDEKYIQEAFHFFEKNKYLLLLEKLKVAEASNKAGVPDSLTELERNLNAELKFLQDKIDDLQKKKDNNYSKLQVLNSRLFNVMRDIEKLHNQFELNYPNYFKIKYQDVTTTLTDLKIYSVKNNASIIQYFWGDSSIYAIGVTGSQTRFIRLGNTKELKDSISQFVAILKEVNLSSKEKFRDFVYLSSKLYARLVNPLLKDLPKEKSESVIFIPDGSLSKLSFEALLTSCPFSLKFSYKNLPFMIYKYNVEYAYSSNILLSNSKPDREKYRNKLIGFGYSGKNKDRKDSNVNLGLPGTDEEMKAVALFFKSDIYVGKSASEYNFKRKVANYDIVHLALHGSADEESEAGSKLFFRTENDKVEDGMLFANEIYNLNLKAKLVVLSACETGLGKNYGGEGVFSMARAFAYAGCPSMIMSLWKVNDHSTSILMNNFYTHISRGEPIGGALHHSKLEFLQNADEISAQPFFWASFVSFGDMSPIKPKFNRSYWFPLILVVIGVIFIISYLLRKRLIKI